MRVRSAMRTRAGPDLGLDPGPGPGSCPRILSPNTGPHTAPSPGPGPAPAPGAWRNENMNGKGTYYYADGNIYEGQWVEGNKHGEGSHTWVDGQVSVPTFLVTCCVCIEAIARSQGWMYIVRRPSTHCPLRHALT